MNGATATGHRPATRAMLARPRPRRITVSLPPEPAAVPQARRHARAALAAWGRDDIACDFETVVSELATNAVRHAATPGLVLPGPAVPVPAVPGPAVSGPAVPSRIRLRITDCPPGAAVEVWDASDQLPRAALAGPPGDAPGGRGLLIVAALAARHGYRRTPGGGKTVWALITPAAS